MFTVYKENDNMMINSNQPLFILSAHVVLIGVR